MHKWLFLMIGITSCGIFKPNQPNPKFVKFNYIFTNHSVWKIDSFISRKGNIAMNLKDSGWCYRFDSAGAKVDFLVDGECIIKGRLMKSVRKDFNYNDSCILFFPIGRRKIDVYHDVRNILDSDDWGYNIQMEENVANKIYYRFIHEISGKAVYTFKSDILVLSFSNARLYLSKG